MKYKLRSELKHVFFHNFNISQTLHGGIKNFKKIQLTDSNILNVVTHGCPLYLDNGLFVSPGDNLSIADSKINKRWSSDSLAIKLLQEFCDKHGLTLNLTYYFADKKIILRPGYEVCKLQEDLKHHLAIYDFNLNKLFAGYHHNYKLVKYSDIDFDISDIFSDVCPDYDFSDSVVSDHKAFKKEVMISENYERLASFLHKLCMLGLCEEKYLFSHGRIKKRVIRRFTKLMQYGGINIAFILLGQYAIYSELVARIHGNALYLYFEGLPYLLTDINTFSKSSLVSNMPRVEHLY